MKEKLSFLLILRVIGYNFVDIIVVELLEELSGIRLEL